MPASCLSSWQINLHNRDLISKLSNRWADKEIFFETRLIQNRQNYKLSYLQRDLFLFPESKRVNGKGEEATVPTERKVKWKFNIGDRVRASEKAPGDYVGLEGMVVERGPGKSEYGVRFDRPRAEREYLSSWWLDRIF